MRDKGIEFLAVSRDVSLGVVPVENFPSKILSLFFHRLRIKVIFSIKSKRIT